MPTRLGQILSGAVVALIPRLPGCVPSRAKDPIALLCLIALFGVGAQGAHPRFVGYQSYITHAFVPVAATALLIVTVPGTRLVSWLLQQRILVGIGLQSYSLYLWHWPLLAFARYLTTTGSASLRPWESFGVLSFAVVLAHLAYRYVEKPMRRNRKGLSAKRTLLRFVPVSVVAAAVAAAVFFTGGVPSRFSTRERKILNAVRDQDPMQTTCWNHGGVEPFPLSRCGIHANAHEDLLLVWGDSHAGSIVTGLSEAAHAAGLGTYLVTHGSCAPIPGVRAALRNWSDDDRDRCDRHNERLFTDVLADPRIKGVALMALWDNFVSLRGEGVEALRSVRDDVRVAAVEAERRDFATKLRLMATQLVAAQKRLILLGPVPVLDFEPARCLAFDPRFRPLFELIGRKEFLRDDCSMPASVVAKKSAFVRGVFAELAREMPGTLFIDLEAQLCNVERCVSHIDDTVFYFDNNHLTMSGSRFVLRSPEFVASLRGDDPPTPSR